MLVMRRLWMASLTTALAISACGDEGARPAPESAAWLARDVRSCLTSSGAKQATTSNDLAFFRQDREADNIDKPGFFENQQFIAEAYGPSSLPDTGQPYVIYVLQPWDRVRSGSGPDPIEALDDPQGAAVWYLPAGSSAPRRDVESCFETAVEAS